VSTWDRNPTHKNYARPPPALVTEGTKRRFCSIGNSDSKAAGRSEKPAALPSSPIRAVYAARHRLVVGAATHLSAQQVGCRNRRIKYSATAKASLGPSTRRCEFSARSDCRGSGARRRLTRPGGMDAGSPRDQLPSCSPKMRHDGSPPTLESCRSFCGSSGRRRR
jgi:hypothetical protein